MKALRLLLFVIGLIGFVDAIRDNDTIWVAVIGVLLGAMAICEFLLFVIEFNEDED